MNISALQPYIPENSLLFIEKWLKPYSFILKIKRERENKLGDYKRPKSNEPHIITVNNNLSKELCFLTITHEIAHLLAFKNNSHKKILPHGIEWKSVFTQLIQESFHIYSTELQTLLIPFSKNPKASFYADKKLAYYFLKQENPNLLTLEDINFGEIFLLKNKTFEKVKKQKLRYICKELSTKKLYLVSPIVAVQKILENEKR